MSQCECRELWDSRAPAPPPARISSCLCRPRKTFRGCSPSSGCQRGFQQHLTAKRAGSEGHGPREPAPACLRPAAGAVPAARPPCRREHPRLPSSTLCFQRSGYIGDTLTACSPKPLGLFPLTALATPEDSACFLELSGLCLSPGSFKDIFWWEHGD